MEIAATSADIASATLSVAAPIVGVLLAVALGFAIWALREMGLAARSMRELSEDTHTRLVPLLDKADVTVDAVNAELLRIDGIITTFEDSAERVSSASGTISGIVSAPAEIVNDVATRVRSAWKDRHRHAEPGPSAEAQEEPDGEPLDS